MSSHRDAHPYGRSAQDVRRRNLRSARTRRMRITQLVVFSVLLLALVGVGLYAWNVFREPPASPAVIADKTFREVDPTMACPEAGAVPADPSTVTVTVLNGTGESGLAGAVTERLAARGFDTEEAGNTRSAEGPVTIVHGPEGYLAAGAVAAQVEGPTLQLGELEGAAVNVLLGDGFTGLLEEEQAAQRLAEEVPVPENC